MGQELIFVRLPLILVRKEETINEAETSRERAES